MAEGGSAELGGQAGVPEAERHFVALMGLHASNVSLGLDESWQRPVRHNKKIERTALADTVELESYCTRVIEGVKPDFYYHPPTLPLSSLYGPAETRYDIEAAIRTIPELLPFSRSEIDRLQMVNGNPDKMGMREPELTARWHSWLWDSFPDDVVPKAAQDEPRDYGRSSELALATSRLVSGLRVLLSLGAGG